MKTKEIAIEKIRELPDDATWEDIKDRIDFMAGVRKAISELDQGKSFDHEKIKKELKEWTSKSSGR